MSDRPSWHNPMPSSNPPKPKTRTGGYTKPDNAVRCKKCGVGKDECGGLVGTPIATYTVSAQLPEPDEKGYGSVAVAEVPMCYKCRSILPFKILDGGLQYGITGSNIIKCLKASRGMHFTLDELLTGKIETPEKAPSFTEPQEPEIENVQEFDPERIGETVQEAIF